MNNINNKSKKGSNNRSEENAHYKILTFLITVIIIIIILLLRSCRSIRIIRDASYDVNPYLPVIIPDENISTEGKDDTDINKTNMSFSYTDELHMKYGSENAQFLFQNPSKSKYDYIIELQISDTELINKIGKTGRTSDQVAIIEKAHNYNSDMNRVKIGESEMIFTGYQISNFKVENLPDGTVLPVDTYNALLFLRAFTKDTREEIAINAQLPVKLIIEGE